jgi:hypothetical protein
MAPFFELRQIEATKKFLIENLGEYIEISCNILQFRTKDDYGNWMDWKYVPTISQNSDQTPAMFAEEYYLP